MLFNFLKREKNNGFCYFIFGVGKNNGIEIGKSTWFKKQVELPVVHSFNNGRFGNYTTIKYWN